MDEQLVTAFQAVESTQKALQTADQNQKAETEKLASAVASKAQADTDDATAVVTANDAIDNALAVLKASRRPVPATVTVKF
jgi:hypothetical protein